MGTSVIGVLAHACEQELVREFFELFKTPWEFFREDGRYDLLLVTGEIPHQADPARLVLLYSSQTLPGEEKQRSLACKEQRSGALLEFTKGQFPLFGRHRLFPEQDSDLLIDAGTGYPVAYRQEFGERVVVRIGYDLFSEIGHLLTVGQPIPYAAIPTLDLHIELLRELILASGLSLAEIPPVPAGFSFIGCLTHDVDHPRLASHRFDHTMFGFLQRAIAGSFLDFLCKRISARDFVRTWNAALQLPLVLLGLARDFWSEFANQYLRIENKAPSTFFLIPFARHAGRTRTGAAPPYRAARYELSEIARSIRALEAGGAEIGLHGLDAWLNASQASVEAERIRAVTNTREIGVRMHWLYFDEDSYAALEQGGLDYDSTFGYNQTVGYRAGTNQVYKPVSVTRLLELPLHIMDTALFLPAHLHLTFAQANERVRPIVEHAVRRGGCVVVNWHDRSLAPERCWGPFYEHLLSELRTAGAWFASASQAVAWFRKRRSAKFIVLHGESGNPEVRIETASDDLPALELRIHPARRVPDASALVTTLASV